MVAPFNSGVTACAHPHAAIDINALYHRELTVFSGYSSEGKDLLEALRLLSGGRIDVSPYLADIFPLQRFDEALRRFRSREILKAILMPTLS